MQHRYCDDLAFLCTLPLMYPGCFPFLRTYARRPIRLKGDLSKLRSKPVNRAVIFYFTIAQQKFHKPVSDTL